MYECLLFTTRTLNEVHRDEDDRFECPKENRLLDYAGVDDRFRDKLIKEYSEEHGLNIQYPEAFEICEYGGRSQRRT